MGMSKIALIKDDNLLGIDGVFRTVDLSALVPSAVHFDTATGVGEEEYNGKQNLKITDIAKYQAYLTAWTNAVTVPQPQVIPSFTVVSMRQARLALLQSGYLNTVNAAISQGSQQNQITWEYATEVNKADPLVAEMSLALNLTEQDLDNLFTLAASL